jgi:hypothetical protein
MSVVGLIAELLKGAWGARSNFSGPFKAETKGLEMGVQKQERLTRCRVPSGEPRELRLIMVICED